MIAVDQDLLDEIDRARPREYDLPGYLAALVRVGYYATKGMAEEVRKLGG